MKMRRNRFFTLLEVIIALVIFAMGLGVTLNITSLSRVRTGKAYRMALEEHILSQAVEYFLLVSTEEEIPKEIFPYTGYTAKMILTEAADLPDNMSVALGDFKLGVMTVELYNEDKELCRTLKMERILPVSK